MNHVDAYVVEVIGEPYESYNRWWVKVKYDSWGTVSETSLMFKTKEEAENVKEGYKFVC